MTATSARGFPPVAESNPNQTEHLRQIARRVNGILGGGINCTKDVTLTANAASTTITDARISYTSIIAAVMPMTANAAAALATTYVAQATIKKGSAVVTHANNAQADKTFRFLILGG